MASRMASSLARSMANSLRMARPSSWACWNLSVRPRRAAAICSLSVLLNSSLIWRFRSFSIASLS